MQYLQRLKLSSNRSSFKLFNQVIFQHFYSTNRSFDAGQPTPITHPKLLKEDEITPGITCDEYISRRKRILELLPEQSVAIFAAAPVKMMTDVVPYPFRQDADYLYITGCHQPGGVAVLGHDFGLVMFMPQLSTHDITWQGQLAGVDAATEYFKANMAYPINKLPMVKDGDLLVMDIGCELHGYVSDLTRTWPPCGRFSDVHREVYDLILETNKECIELCKPGMSIQHVQNYSVDKLARGLKEIGILKDNQLNSYRQLNPTNIGHYLGMDVHDCSKISYDRTLKPGVVITIEPGVYIPLNFDCAQRYQGLGIRIEDELLITETGYEVLTGSLPKEVNQIETLLNHHSYEVKSRD